MAPEIPDRSNYVERLPPQTYVASRPGVSRSHRSNLTAHFPGGLRTPLSPTSLFLSSPSLLFRRRATEQHKPLYTLLEKSRVRSRLRIRDAAPAVVTAAQGLRHPATPTCSFTIRTTSSLFPAGWVSSSRVPRVPRVPGLYRVTPGVHLPAGGPGAGGGGSSPAPPSSTPPLSRGPGGRCSPGSGPVHPLNAL